MKKEYLWTTSKYSLVTEDVGNGAFTVKKVPFGDPTVARVGNWDGECTVEKASEYVENRWPGNMVIKVEAVEEREIDYNARGGYNSPL